VIVVLVILAILAAIAIPALTGYIDKAQWKGLVIQCKTQMTAVQTMITDQIVRNGGVTTHSAIDYTSTDDYFVAIYDELKYIDDNHYRLRPGEGYAFSTFTIAGKDEYEHLTGDNESFANAKDESDKPWERPVAYTDPNGAIRVYTYVCERYFDDAPDDLLIVGYIPNIDSSDPVTKQYLEWFNNFQYFNQTGEWTNGWNVWRVNGKSGYYTSVKLD
jgi:type II secretory pathway pseudopilin PulG